MKHEVSRCNTREVTMFRYRDIFVEVKAPQKPAIEMDGWVYYLYLQLDWFEDTALGESLWLPLVGDDRPMYRPNYHEFLVSLWWHGGLTWYSKHLGLQEERVIQVGCDYQHLWDQGQHYTRDQVMRDAQRTIDNLHDQVVYRNPKEG